MQSEKGMMINKPNTRPIVRLEGVTKKFGDFVAVDQLTLEINEGEIFALLGGSGSGKTTLLRMIAGFETLTEGRIIIGDEDMADVPPYRRPANMMFQSYALFPHMNVFRNVAYGLKKEGVRNPELTRRVEAALELVHMSEFARRDPAQLSGGQRQRVALARALVKRPKILLLDEPLAALDKSLREKTQLELVKIQREVGITFIVVTHDQEEAMSMANRIAILDKGRFAQIGKPSQIYEQPNSRFVANFVGTINFFEAVVETVNNGTIYLTYGQGNTPLVADAPAGGRFSPGQKVCLAVRPEQLSQTQGRRNERNVLQGFVEEKTYLGANVKTQIRLDTGERVVSSLRGHDDFERGDRVDVSWPPSASIILTE